MGTMHVCDDTVAVAEKLYSECKSNRLCTRLEVGYRRKRRVRNDTKVFEICNWKKESLSAEKKKRLWEKLIWVG